MKLSLSKYGWRCVLGAEVAYALCLAGGYVLLRTQRGIDLHHSIFETLPGFVWGRWESVALGAAYIFVFAWIFAAYMVWMFNESIEHK